MFLVIIVITIISTSSRRNDCSMCSNHFSSQCSASTFSKVEESESTGVGWEGFRLLFCVHYVAATIGKRVMM